MIQTLRSREVLLVSVLALFNIQSRIPLSAGEAPLPWSIGDCNRDAKADISDAVATLQYLFQGGNPVCAALCDLDGDGHLRITDPIILLTHLFTDSSRELPQPDPVPEEICDGVDNDCDGCADESCQDTEGDTGGDAVIQLSWDPVVLDIAGNPETVDGYRVHYGTASRRYCSTSRAGSTETFTLTGLRSGVRYYIAVTAVDGSGNESGYSNEVSRFPTILQ